MEKKNTVIVLGAGYTGLSAAWRLCEGGHDVIVLEEQPFVGGLGATVREAGYHLDFGPHPFYSEHTGIIDTVNALLPNEMLSFERNCLLYLNGRYLNYPLNPKNAVFQMGMKSTVAAPISYLYAKLTQLLKPKRGDSFEDWAIGSFGNYLYKIFFKPYTEKFWGIPCKELASTWADARISKMSFLKTIRSMFRKEKKVESLIDRDRLKLHYPKKGIGAIPEAIAREVEKSKGKIMLGVKAEEIIQNGNGFTVVCNKGKKERKFSADRIVSTIPITGLVKLLNPKAPPAIRESADRLGYMSLIIIYLVTDRQDVLSCPYIYFMGRAYHRATEANKFSPHLSPENENMVSLEISCYAGDELWDMSDKELVELCIRDLEKDNLMERSEVKNSFVIKAPYAYSVYRLGYKEYLNKVIGYLNNIENLETIGRQGRFNYMDMDQCIKEGFDAADRLMAGWKN